MTVTTSVNDLHYAVVVGIDRYPALTDLSGARRDARSFHDWLVDPNGGALPAQNVRVVEASPMDTPLAEVLPTQRQFDAALFSVHRSVRAAIEADSHAFDRTRLYVFVAGHGIKPHDGSGALLMADATWELLGLNVDLARYVAWQEDNALFNEVFVFADCCRVARNVRNSSGPPFTDDPTGRKTTAVLAYATTADRAALASPYDRGRGIFTRALLEALKGRGANSNGEVTLDSVERHVNARLTGLQVSEFRPSRSACVVLRIPATERKVRFLFREPFYGIIELMHGDGWIETLPVAGVEMCRQLKPGLYHVTALGPDAPEFLDDGRVRLNPGNGPVDVTL